MSGHDKQPPLTDGLKDMTKAYVEALRQNIEAMETEMDAEHAECVLMALSVIVANTLTMGDSIRDYTDAWWKANPDPRTQAPNN